jgi:membrane protein insertase Oxa1/YidC/SpoIIIJ
MNLIRLISPVMIGVVSLAMPAALPLYLAAGGVYNTILQTLMFNRQIRYPSPYIRSVLVEKSPSFPIVSNCHRSSSRKIDQTHDSPKKARSFLLVYGTSGLFSFHKHKKTAFQAAALNHNDAGEGT